MYIYILCATSHLVILSCRQSYLVYKLVSSIIDLSFSDVAFSVWYLRFSIYWQDFFFLTVALNLSSCCLLLCSFTVVPSDFRVNVQLLFKHSTAERSTIKPRFRKFCKYLSVYPWFIRCVQKNSSMKDLIYPFCLSKCFSRNILIQSNLWKTVIIPKRFEWV